MSFAIQQQVAAGLITFHLAGFRGYPNSEAGLNVFARCLQECCVSVEHAEGVLKSFDLEFPTLRDIITTATTMRGKYEVAVSPLVEWEKKYGKPEPFDTSMEGHCLCCGRPWADILARTAPVGCNCLQKP
jgi:hypothetical protein